MAIKERVGGRQQAVSLSVISYSLLERAVAMSCLDDFYDFFAFYGSYYSLLSVHRLPFTVYYLLKLIL